MLLSAQVKQDLTLTMIVRCCSINLQVQAPIRPQKNIMTFLNLVT